ncbi:MAG: hypothetical protein NT154_38585 [Verrucomicrobia bacterium]|nr:hypothetical protein [Verrucomicrobiota bacterium]
MEKSAKFYCTVFTLRSVLTRAGLDRQFVRAARGLGGAASLLTYLRFRINLKLRSSSACRAMA